jgi:hypothetical protein
MNEEELQFLIILGCGGIIACAITLDSLFSINKFWARHLRSKSTPTPQELVKAHTKHSTFYHYTHQRLFSTTYVSFYLFALSLIGIIAILGIILIQNFLNNSVFSTDDRLIRLWPVLFFFLLSRWNYRQDHNYSTGHKLTAVLSGVILIDFVHIITGESYIQVGTILLLLWIWLIGILRAIVNYEVSYQRDIAFSIGIPFALLYFLVRTDAGVLLLIIGPVFILAVAEFLNRSEFSYTQIKRFFPRPLPFTPAEPDSFIADFAHSAHPEIFKHCSVYEVLFWGLMTPILLVPAVLYLQSREEQLKQQRKHIIEWSEKEYVLNPDTVADRLGISLVKVYPLLNELVDTKELTVYESPRGLLYGLSPSGEMKAFVKKLHLRETELPTKDRELLEYIEGKTRIQPAKTVMISVIKQENGIEVSTEQVGGTVSAVVSSVFMDINPLEIAAKDINKAVEIALATLKYQRQYKIDDASTFLSKLQKKGHNLFECVIPEGMSEFEMPYMLIETNTDDIPFELMWDSDFFALQYSMGRRLKVKSVQNKKEFQGVKTSENDSIRALIIADPTNDLPEAVTECNIIKEELERLMDVKYIEHKEATCEYLLSGFREGYTIIHYAGHVTDHGLQLSDGVLPPDEIVHNVGGTPLTFINGCKSAGIAHTELAQGFLQGGSLGYIGSIWDIHDEAAAWLAVDFYLNAFYFYRIGEALRMAKESAFKENNFAWLCFVLFGDPTLTLL